MLDNYLDDDHDRYETQLPLSQEVAMALFGATPAPGGGYLLEPRLTTTPVPIRVGDHDAGMWLPTNAEVHTPVGKPAVFVTTFIKVDRQSG